jgi:hypothetical protein
MASITRQDAGLAHVGRADAGRVGQQQQERGDHQRRLAQQRQGAALQLVAAEEACCVNIVSGNLLLACMSQSAPAERIAQPTIL